LVFRLLVVDLTLVFTGRLALDAVEDPGFAFETGGFLGANLGATVFFRGFLGALCFFLTGVGFFPSGFFDLRFGFHCGFLYWSLLQLIPPLVCYIING